MYLDVLMEEIREHDYLTRCEIPAGNGCTKLCRHKCPEECPFRYDPDDPILSKNSPDAIFDMLAKRNACSTDALFEEKEWEPEAIVDDTNEIYEERKAKVWNELHILTERQQLIIKLYSEGKTVTEIAKLLNISKASVSEHLKKAIKALKERVAG